MRCEDHTPGETTRTESESPQTDRKKGDISRVVGDIGDRVVGDISYIRGDLMSVIGGKFWRAVRSKKDKRATEITHPDKND